MQAVRARARFDGGIIVAPREDLLVIIAEKADGSFVGEAGGRGAAAGAVMLPVYLGNSPLTSGCIS